MVRVLIALLLALLSSTRVYAVEVPSFPACASPSGSLIASYDNGTHGIVGSTSTYTGSDKVYQISQVTYTQCFCSENGQGIQSNWWNAGNLSEDEIKVLKTLGWNYVPSGAAWGLTQDSYLAKNSEYSCLNSSPLPSSTPSPSSSGSHEYGGGSSSEDNGVGGGDILGLAATGNILTLIAVFGASLTSLYFGIKKLLS